MNYKEILNIYEVEGLEKATKYVLQKYASDEIENEYFYNFNYPLKKAPEVKKCFSIIENAYNRRNGEPLTKENEEQLAEEIKNLFDNQDELENAIEECSHDYLNWYYSSTLSKFTLPDTFVSNFFIKNLLLNKNMTIEFGDKIFNLYLNCFKNSPLILHNDLDFILNNNNLSSKVLLEYLNIMGPHLDVIDIIRVIKSNKADSLVLELLIDKCFDEKLVYKLVSPISSRLWGGSSIDGIPNIKILRSILFKESIDFEIFNKVLKKIKICSLKYKMLDCIPKINQLFRNFVISEEIPKEKIVEFIIEYSFVLRDYKEIILQFGVEDLTRTIKYSSIDCYGLIDFIKHEKADESVFNIAIIKSLAQSPSFYLKVLINNIQARDPSYNNCLCNAIKEKCSISGEYNRVFHPLLLSFCVANNLDSNIRDKCCNLESTENIDFEGLDNYFYDNNIISVDDLLDEDGSFRSEISTNIKKFLGNDLSELFEYFCKKLRSLFDVEKYELDYYSNIEYDNDCDKFIVLFLLINNTISKNDKLDKFIKEKLGDWYKMIYYSKIFNKKFKPNKEKGRIK